MQAFASGHHRIRRFGIVNAFLVGEADGLTLIDTTLPGGARRIGAPGHVALLDARDRTLFCGDAYSTLGGVETAARVNPRFPLPGLATWDKPTSVETARRLRAPDPARLAPGRGKVVESPAAAMDAALARVS